MYIIGGSVVWGVGRGVGVEFDREIWDVVDIDFGDNIEIDDGRKVDLKVEGETFSENGISVSKYIKF